MTPEFLKAVTTGLIMTTGKKADIAYAEGGWAATSQIQETRDMRSGGGHLPERGLGSSSVASALSLSGPAGWSVSPQNQVRLSLAGLVLLVLVVLVAEACYSHKRSFYGLRSDPYLSIMTNTEDTRGV